MNSRTALKSALPVLAALLLSACGGGSGGGQAIAPPPPPPPPDSGIEGSGIAVGTISGFGSVIVNGVRYDTSSATITVDSVAATEADLAVGDVVVIVGEVDDNGVDGTAETVALDHVVEGPVASIDAAAGTFAVLGQTVTVNEFTSFDDDIQPESLDGLSVGDTVEVSGFVAADGTVLATRIELDDDTQLELTGVVTALDTGVSRFEINGQAIDYAAATLSDFDSDGIADGDLVEVKGNEIDNDGVFIATSVELKDDDLEIEEGDELEIEGLITRFGSAQDFDVAGIPVTTGAGTEFEDGVAADLALDVRVEVEGELNAAGVLVADKVKLRRDADVRVAAAVDSVTTDGLVVLGVTVRIDSLTRFEDESDMAVTAFGLDDINVGDYVEVRGSASPDAPDELLAVLVERDDDETEAEVRGPVDSIDAVAESLVIFGVTVDTDADTEFERDDQSLTAEDFFAEVTVGDLVEAEGTETGDSALLADEIEFEDDD